MEILLFLLIICGIMGSLRKSKIEAAKISARALMESQHIHLYHKRMLREKKMRRIKWALACVLVAWIIVVSIHH